MTHRGVPRWRPLWRLREGTPPTVRSCLGPTPVAAAEHLQLGPPLCCLASSTSGTQLRHRGCLTATDGLRQICSRLWTLATRHERTSLATRYRRAPRPSRLLADGTDGEKTRTRYCRRTTPVTEARANAVSAHAVNLIAKKTQNQSHWTLPSGATATHPESPTTTRAAIYP